jgi:hypothetical protein
MEFKSKKIEDKANEEVGNEDKARSMEDERFKIKGSW